jgi:hypothetical protein
MQNDFAKYCLLTLFAIAFAWIESAVVHYLHLHFYPDGFAFPLVLWPLELAAVEFGREIATVIVLATVAILAARTAWNRFAWFMFLFGIWDIFYYVWLQLFEGWPGDLLTMDLLFLVPVPWAGPVLAPVLVSIGLIISAVLILQSETRGVPFIPGKAAVILTLAGWAVILISFMWDAAPLIERGEAGTFHWEVFIAGMMLWIAGLGVVVRRTFLKEPTR